MPAGGDWSGVGSGWKRYAEVLVRRCSGHPVADGDALIHAGDVAVVAGCLYTEGAAVAAEQAVPVYLRDDSIPTVQLDVVTGIELVSYTADSAAPTTSAFAVPTLSQPAQVIRLRLSH